MDYMDMLTEQPNHSEKENTKGHKMIFEQLLARDRGETDDGIRRKVNGRARDKSFSRKTLNRYDEILYEPIMFLPSHHTSAIHSLE